MLMPPFKSRRKAVKGHNHQSLLKNSYKDWIEEQSKSNNHKNWDKYMENTEKHIIKKERFKKGKFIPYCQDQHRAIRIVDLESLSTTTNFTNNRSRINAYNNLGINKQT